MQYSELRFLYDALGNRVVKEYVPGRRREIYVRDGQGNVLAVYEAVGESLFTKEYYLYGVQRLGYLMERRYLGRRCSRLPCIGPPVVVQRILGLPSGIGRPSVVADSVVELLRGSRRYELSDWLGNVQVVVSDARVPVQQGGQLRGYRAEVVRVGDYYSSGAEIRDRSYEVALGYLWGYQAQEKDNEIYGRGAWYYYRYRQQDARLERFWRVDPLTGKYPWNSPYAFAEYRLVDGVEWEGLEIILVNEYNARGMVGRVIGSQIGGEGYWGPGFVEAARRFFSDCSPITFIDGSSFMGIDQSGHDRWLRGIEYVMRNIQQLDKIYREGGHDSKIVTHSEGAAYGAGVAYALIKAGYNLSMVVHLSPEEPTEFETPEEPYTIVYGGDWVVGEERISKGLDRLGVVSHDYSWTEVHGATKSADVLKAVEDLMKVKVRGQVGPDRKFRHRQVEGSVPHGTIFSQVDEKRIEAN